MISPKLMCTIDQLYPERDAHPRRLADRTKTDDEHATAVLHDAIEDGLLTLEEVRQLGVSKTVLAAVALITRDKTQPYPDYIAQMLRQAGTPAGNVALTVKALDILDHLDPYRAATLPPNKAKLYGDSLGRILDTLRYEQKLAATLS